MSVIDYQYTVATTARNGDIRGQILLFLQLLSLALTIGGIWNGAGRNLYNSVTGGYRYDDGVYLYRTVHGIRPMAVDTTDTLNVRTRRYR